MRALSGHGAGEPVTYRGLGCDAEENAVLASLCSYEKQVMLVSLSVPLAFQVCGCSLGRKAQCVALKDHGLYSFVPPIPHAGLGSLRARCFVRNQVRGSGRPLNSDRCSEHNNCWCFCL